MPATLVPPENVSGRCGVFGKRKWLCGMREGEIVEACDVKIEVAIAVVVDKCHAKSKGVRWFARTKARLFGDILERAVSFVVKENDSVAGGDGEVGMAVVVVVAHGAAHSFTVK